MITNYTTRAVLRTAARGFPQETSASNVSRNDSGLGRLAFHRRRFYSVIG